MAIMFRILVFAAALFVTAVSSGPVCPAGWEKPTEFPNKCYKVQSASKNFQAAQDACVALGGALVSVESNEENTYIFSLAGFPQTDAAGLWLGFTKVSGSFSWVDNSTSTFTLWSFSEPDGTGGCVYIGRGSMWSDEDCSTNKKFVCNKPSACSAPPSLDHASLAIYSSTDVGTSVHYTCDAGYQLATHGAPLQNSTCLVTREWTPLTGCELVDCGNVTVVQYASSNYGLTTYGSVVTYSCDQGYYSNGTTNTSDCLVNGTWSYVQFSCAASECSGAPSIAHGSPESLVVGLGAIRTYWCNAGYEFPDMTTKKDTTCETSLTWNPSTLPDCQIKHCQPARNVTNAVRNGTGTEFASLVTFTCLNGYKMPSDLSTVKTIYCSNFKHWTPDIDQECRIITKPCQPIVAPIMAYAVSNSTEMGTIVGVRCVRGYRYIDDDSEVKFVECVQGQWNRTITTECKMVNCSRVPVVNGTELVSFTGVMYEDTATYECINGSVFLTGDTVRSSRCNSGRKWVPEVQACRETAVKIRVIVNRPPAEAPVEVVAATASFPLAISLGFILGMIVLDIATLGRQLRHMMANLKHFKYRMNGTEPPKKKKVPTATLR